MHQLCRKSGSILATTFLSYSALATPARIDTAIAATPLLLEKSMPSFLLAPLSSVRASRARATPAHCQPFSCSPNSTMENSTTKKGLEALRVLTVVMGRSLRPMRPLTQEVVTSTALRISLKWSSTGPEDRKGERNRVERAVAASSTHSTLLFLSACFLKTSYMPSIKAEPRVIQSHISYKVCPPMNSLIIEVGGTAAISLGLSALTASRNFNNLVAFS